MTRRPLSVCIITRNEEDNLPRCLDSVPFADEVVVLDCGSTDRTQDIARERGAVLHVEEFRGHVRQKARAVELAGHDWVLCVDADEELSPALQAQVRATLERHDDPTLGYELPRKTWYLGRFIEHSGWWPEYRLRLFDRRRGGWTGRDPHDRVELEKGAAVRRLEGPLYHYNYRDLAHHIEKVNAYTSIMAREMAREGQRFRWRDLWLRPPVRFLKMFVLRRGFLDGWRGLVLAIVGSFYVFLKYLKLRELEGPAPAGTAADGGTR